ncbi:hypothetical protein J6590_012524 [Homalodisca vitripennis]|nr:hypothetical protein J6590_012524 [Homalodisca vitripennis]
MKSAERGLGTRSILECTVRYRVERRYERAVCGRVLLGSPRVLTKPRVGRLKNEQSDSKNWNERDNFGQTIEATSEH